MSAEQHIKKGVLPNKNQGPHKCPCMAGRRLGDSRTVGTVTEVARDYATSSCSTLTVPSCDRTVRGRLPGLLEGIESSPLHALSV